MDHEVYQLNRAPRMVPCGPEIEEEICQEIFDSLKDDLQHMQDPAQPEEPGQGSASTSRLDPWSQFQWRMQMTPDHFWSRWQESCEEALRVAWDTHHQVLVAVALLEGHIKRLSCSGSHGQMGSCQHSHSRGCSRSHGRHPLAGNKEQIPSAADCTGDSVKGWAPSPSPARLSRQVTFKEHSMGGHLSVGGSLLNPD